MNVGDSAETMLSQKDNLAGEEGSSTVSAFLLFTLRLTKVHQG